jgi:hypothetical protein
MAEEDKTKLRLEIGHILFIDIVGYSKLLINEQSDQIQTLRQIVRGTRQFLRFKSEGDRARNPPVPGCGSRTFDRKPAFWQSGSVKTTLDLPDDLMRAVKIRAVHEGKKLKDAIAEFIRKGMAVGQSRPAKAPKPVKLRGGFKPTAEDIEAAIAWGRD